MANEAEQRATKSGKLARIALIVGCLAVLGAVFSAARLVKSSDHVLKIKCHFKDSQGLQSGAKVKLAGVEVGTVSSIQVRPELGEYPVEVNMVLRTPYEVKIPNDSVVQLETEGVLGNAFADIETHKSSGPPLSNGGELKTVSNPIISPQQLLEGFTRAIKEQPCNPAKGETANKKETVTPKQK